MKIGKKLIQWLIKQDFYLANLYQSIRLEREHSRSSDEKILIYQMGKVASTSIYETLKKLSLDAPIYHIHVLKQENINQVFETYKKRFKDIRRIDEHIIHSQYLRKCLNSKQDNSSSKWKVITLVRDPVARDVSKFFYELRHEPDFLAIGQDRNVAKVTKRLTDEYLNRYLDASHPFNWFINELGSVFDIDLSSIQFANSEGYRVYIYDDIELLVLKLESLNTYAEEALQQFLNVRQVNFVTANEGSKVKSGALYQQFRQNAKLPVKYLDKMYRNSLVRKIYSQEEIDRFYERWQNVRRE